VLYFSLATLTTLGYGDIVPTSAVSRMLASVEAVVGQLYLTVLVARLVGLHIAHSIEQAAKTELDRPSGDETKAAPSDASGPEWHHRQENGAGRTGTPPS
jgi:hypothetical protein